MSDNSTQNLSSLATGHDALAAPGLATFATDLPIVASAIVTRKLAKSL